MRERDEKQANARQRRQVELAEHHHYCRKVEFSNSATTSRAAVSTFARLTAARARSRR